MKRSLIFVLPIIFSIVGCSSGQEQTILPTPEPMLLYRNNVYGYTIQYPKKGYSLAGYGYSDSVEDVPEITLGGTGMGAMISAWPETLSEVGMSLEEYAKKYWEEHQGAECGKTHDELSPLKKIQLGQSEGFLFTLERGCAEGVSEKHRTFILTGNEKVKLIVFFDSADKFYLPIIKTIRFFPPCGGEKYLNNPPCSSDTLKSGVYEQSGSTLIELKP